MSELTILGEKAREASRRLALSTDSERNRALTAMAEALIREKEYILAENAKDLRAGEQNGMSDALLDRLRLTEARIADIAKAMTDITELPDPLGRVTLDTVRPNGLHITRTSVPIGVIAVIYEARPNVTADSAALCLKSGNAVILRGGKEAIFSNIAVAETMRSALRDTGLSEDCLQLVRDTSRSSATELMGLRGYVDVLIPRGGQGLIRSVVENSSVPVIETGAGTCHTYVDKSADIAMAARIIYNAKTSRPSVCNACECILVHSAIAEKALPEIYRALAEKNVELRGDRRVCAILERAKAASDDDWGKEYHDYILAARVVDSMDEAIDHISRYGTGHSECIVTDDNAAAEEFLARVDAAAVYHNASTRFTDGGEFGFGAEIGISTQKLHARGPLGLAELTSWKYRVVGSGQIR